MKCPKCQVEWEITPVERPHRYPKLEVYVFGVSGSRKSTLIHLMKRLLASHFTFYELTALPNPDDIPVDKPFERISARAKE